LRIDLASLGRARLRRRRPPGARTPHPRAGARTRDASTSRDAWS